MKVKYFANAMCLYEHEGFKLLSDPWIYDDNCFEGSWAHNPPLKVRPRDIADCNLIFLSHTHPDHVDEKCLAELPKTIPILILDIGNNFLRKKVDALGFTNVYTMKDKETRKIGSFNITMYGPFIGHLFHPTEIGNLLDSGIIIDGDGKKVANLNDNAPTESAAKMLFERHGAMDLGQFVDSCAGSYPACFTNLTHEEKLSERDRILKRHLDLMIKCAKIMQCKTMQPFAGHYQLQGPLAELNQYLAVYEPHEVAEIYKKAGIEPLLLYEGDEYEL